MRRRKTAIFFLVFGVCLSGLAIALNVGWILLNLRQVVLLVIGIIFFAAIITGLILNTIFLLREIRRNEQHDAFINSVTHELKTPIASIKLYLETLKARDVDEAQRREFYDIMLADSDRLLNTVEQVLHAGKIKEHTRAPAQTTLNIDDVLTDAISTVNSRYNLGEDSIKYVSGGEPLLVNGNYDELQSAFVNLLDNAVKYSGDKPKVTVKAQSTGFSNRIAVIIRDKGVGIPPTELKRIFKRFYRSDASGNGAKGTGLGLFIVKSIIERYGGRVKAESRGEGKGSTFLVQLPKA
jgi:two-component system, OmpR family, sensor histidine kinase SenX3